MKQLFFTLAIGVGSIFTSQAQLAAGSTAPNFTLTDIDGVQHDLYSYLDAGKTVYIDFFAAHCPYCWNYKNTGALNNLNAQYGINGSVNQEIVILSIELDQNNGIPEFMGGGNGYTQGDWISALSYPIINPEGTDYSPVVNDFDATFYPLIYGICSDKSIKSLGTLSTTGLYNYHTGTCKSSLGVEQIELNAISFNYDSNNQQLSINEEGTYSVIDASGKIYASGNSTGTEIVSLTEAANGLLILILQTGDSVATAKFIK